MCVQPEEKCGSFHVKSTQKMDDPFQISTKLGLQVVPHYLLAQTKNRRQKLCGFYFTALQKLDFSCIFAIPDLMKQIITSFLLNLCGHLLYESVAHEQLFHEI